MDKEVAVHTHTHTHTHTIKYYSAIKRNAFELVLMKWTNLEPIIQSEVSQNKKDKCLRLDIF